MAEAGLGREHKAKCGHAACVCLVEPSQSYCSDWCASSSGLNGSNELPGKTRGGKCQCGHADCEQAH